MIFRWISSFCCGFGIAIVIGCADVSRPENYFDDARELLNVDVSSESGEAFLRDHSGRIASTYRDGICQLSNGSDALNNLLSSKNRAGLFFEEEKNGSIYYFLVSCSDALFRTMARDKVLEWESTILGVDPYLLLYFTKPQRLRYIPSTVHKKKNSEYPIGLMEFTLIYRCTKERVVALATNGVLGSNDFLERRQTSIQRIAKDHCAEALTWIKEANAAPLTTDP